ncbi:hypothetical protein [Bacillus pseudomycoides]|uniref:hypothetical protein n=1 Tax=Bacillus pseudomycoides TaxID=64104 RepID=UPI000BFDB774|nr:hypothetical protein [Bacillus pseudomycoides]PGD98553.1 hypothetical protein COM49_23690 [Bacillus pseudomycoides]PHG16708.1 hypothetical protein COI47_25005 [Bacillus pseudomycoides]
MSEFKKNTIATEEDFFKLSSDVYNNDFFHKGSELIGTDDKKWKVIESINANDKGEVKNGLQAIAVVPADKYDENATHYDDIILAFRGTEADAFDGDIPTDLFQIILGMKKNYRRAGGVGTTGVTVTLPSTFDTGLEWAKNKVVEKYTPTSLHTTGHSKGGAEADLVAAELNCYATTYAAPNPYKLLSPEAKRRVDAGEMENKATDFTHPDDQIGNHTQFGEPLIGKQFTVKHSGVDEGWMANLGMKGHFRPSFEGMFHANGSPILQLEPDDIIARAKEIQKISDTLLRIVESIEKFQRQEEEEVAKLKSQLKHETGPGGKYHLLEEHEVDEAIRKIAKTSQNGKDYFHDVKLAEELIHLLRKKQKELSRFGYDIADAANSLRDKDNQLGTKLEGLAVR